MTSLRHKSVVIQVCLITSVGVLDMEADPSTLKKCKDNESYACLAYTRCVVRRVEHNPRLGSQKILSVDTQPHGSLRSVILRDDWIEANIQEGDIINVLGNFNSEGSIIISSKHNFVIHHPDYLLTVTALSHASQCRRKPLLSALVHSTSDVTASVVWGNILHEVMQTCLAANRWDKQWIDKLIDESVLSHLPDLLKIGVGVEEATREVRLRARGLRVFSERYIAETPKSTAILTNTRETGHQFSTLALTELNDVEEDIWSPKYGLKGTCAKSLHHALRNQDRTLSSRHGASCSDDALHPPRRGAVWR